MKAKVTGVTAWQGTPTGGTLSIRAPRYVDSSGNASPEEYSAVLDVTHNPPRWMDALDPTRELYVIVQGPDDLPGVRGRFYEVLHYGPTKSVRTEFTRKLISSDLSGLIFDYAMPEPTDIPVGFGDAPLTMRAAQQVIEEGGAVVSEWSDIKVDIAQAAAAANQARTDLYAQTFRDLTVVPGPQGGVILQFEAPDKPFAPSGLTITNDQRLSVALGWTLNDPSGTAVVVQRSADGVSWADRATLGATATTYTDTLDADATWQYRVLAVRGVVRSVPSATATRTQMLPGDLAALWTFENSLADGSGNGRTLSIIGSGATHDAQGAHWSNGAFGGLDGGNILSADPSAGIYLLIAYRIPSGNASGFPYLASRYATNNTAGNEYLMLLSPTGLIAGADGRQATVTGTPADGNWHYAEMYLGTNLARVWLDNVAASNTNAGAIPAAGSFPFRLGSRGNAIGNSLNGGDIAGAIALRRLPTDTERTALRRYLRTRNAARPTPIALPNI